MIKSEMPSNTKTVVSAVPKQEHAADQSGRDTLHDSGEEFELTAMA